MMLNPPAKSRRSISHGKIWVAVTAAVMLIFCGEKAAAQKLVSPVHGYVTVEPYSLRKEFVLKVSQLDGVPGLDLAGRDLVDAAGQEAVLGSLKAYLGRICPLTLDGETAALELESAHFIRPDEKETLSIDDRAEIPVAEALVGVVFGMNLDSRPAGAELKWELFPADGSPAVVTFTSGGESVVHRVRPGDPTLTWKVPEPRNVGGKVAVPAPPEIPVLRVPVISIAGLLLALGAVGWFWKSGGKAPFWLRFVPAVGVLMAVIGWKYGGIEIPRSSGRPPLAAEEKSEVTYALLRNIYHAFDYRGESEVYDTLEESVSGDLLTDIYLEVQRSLQLESQGGARVRITEVDLRQCQDAGAVAAEDFAADCEWVAIGSVTHWGHTHQRVNRYRATLGVKVVDEQWKLTRLDLAEEERL